MKKIRMEIELEYDDDTMHGDCEESRQWFLGTILSDRTGDLLLHSNEIGDEVGTVTVLRHIV